MIYIFLNNHHLPVLFSALLLINTASIRKARVIGGLIRIYYNVNLSIKRNKLAIAFLKTFFVSETYSSPLGIFCLCETRVVNAYQRISLFKHVI